jgi:ribulose-phosphate 3-epimerase
MEIIPAILPKNFKEIEEKIDLLNGLTKRVQIDICDGKFVPTITWPYWKEDENFHAILKEERGMPEWESFDYEFDLMISNPTADDARKWLSAGAERIVLHLESSSDLDPVIGVLDGLVQIGIAINTTTDISKLNKYTNRFQYIQIMGIRKAGFQRQKFEITTLNKIKEVKTVFPGLPIQIDGGVTLDTAQLLKDAGADRVVSGSAIFDSVDIVDTLEQFRRI